MDKNEATLDLRYEKELLSIIKTINITSLKFLLKNENSNIINEVINTFTGYTALILACRLGSDKIDQYVLKTIQRKNDLGPNFGQKSLQASVSTGRTCCN